MPDAPYDVPTSGGWNLPRLAPDSFKVHDAGSYDDVAELYDRHIRRLAGPIADHICDLAHIQPGDTVLDVATGTGVAAHRAAELVGPGGRVLGVDLSEGMLRVAAQRAPSQSSGPLSFRAMDAEHLDVAAQSFDSVISLCAVLHFPRLEAALGEMVRVARPGASIVVSYGHVRPIRPAPLARLLASRVAERLLPHRGCTLRAPGAVLATLPEMAIPEHEEAVAAWTKRRPVMTIVAGMRRIGLANVEAQWRGHELVYEQPEAFWEASVAISTRLRKTLQTAPRARVEELRRVFIDHAREIRDRGGTLRYPYGAVFISATRPSEG